MFDVSVEVDDVSAVASLSSSFSSFDESRSLRKNSVLFGSLK